VYYLKPFDPWGFPLCTCPPKYSLDPYTGCGHGCLYCYASSYVKEFRRVRPKRDFLRLLERDLRRLTVKRYVTMSNSSDPYPGMERDLRITRGALALLKRHEVPVMVVTKSDLVERDADLLSEMNAVVCITVTTLDEDTAARLEPSAPPPERRVEAMAHLHERGIPVVARIDPIIPGINEDVAEVIRAVASAGASHVVFSTYKAKGDNFRRMCSAFPELQEMWMDLYCRRGEVVRGVRYLPLEMRTEILSWAVSIAKGCGMTAGLCREGLPFPAPSCDGSHLLFYPP